jgi:hypothetical protein
VTVDAPAWLEIVLMRQRAEYSPDGAERLLIHLLNEHGDRPLDGNYRCTEQILPVRDVQVHVRCAQRPASVHLEPGGEIPAWKYADRILTVQVPEIQIHRAITVA